MKCKTCGGNSEGEYCFRHKPRKKMPSRKGPSSEVVMQRELMRDLFLEIWRERPRRSEVSGKSLGKEPLTVFFHHVLPKEKYPEAALDRENIILLTLEEHDNVEIDPERYEIINEMRKVLHLKYDNLKLNQS